MRFANVPSRRAALCAILLVLPAHAWAADTSESAYLDDVPIVLTVSRLAQPVNEAPAAVTVIDRQMIRDSGAWDLSEVLRLVPGMFVAYHSDRYYATDSTVSYHGLVTNTMSHRMQVLVDGRTVYSPMYGGVIWSDIPVVLDDIERIEVTRGPDSASYGANSFMGVINIITRHSAEAQGQFLSLSAGRGRSEAVARQGGRDGDLSWRLTVAARNDQGLANDIRSPTNQTDIWTRNKFDDKQIRQLNLRTDYQLTQADSLEFQFGYNGGPRQTGELNSLQDFGKTADNHFELLRWRRALDNNGELAVQFFHAVEAISAPLGDFDGNTYNGDALNRRYDLEIQHTFAPTQNTRLVWGASTRYDKSYGPYYLGVRENTYLFGDFPFHLTRLFANLEWRARPDLVFNLGAMEEHNSYTGTDLTPRAALNWHFLPGQTLRLSYSTATRTPTVYEKVYESYWRSPRFAPNLPNLQPERVNSADIGWLGKFRGLEVDFRLFHDRFTELIGAENRAAAMNGSLNAGSATIKGFETQVKWQIGENTRLVYSLAHGVVASPNVYNIQYTNSLPTNSQNLLLTHRFNSHWSASLAGYQVGETHMNDTDYDPRQNRGWFIPTYRRWDARLAYGFPIGKGRGEVALHVQNLLDAEYYEYRHDNQPPGRTAWLNLKLDM